MDRDTLLARYQDAIIPWGPIGEPVFRRTYSHTKLDGRKETWPETLTRAVLGNVELVGRAPNPVLVSDEEITALAELLLNFSALPAGRHLNASGVMGRQFLFNCLSGETLVQTRQGLKPIRSLEGEVEILSLTNRTKSGVGCWTVPATGTWRKATFKSYGAQKLYEVVFSDGTKVKATADHNWYVTKRSEPVPTTNLAGLDVPLVMAPKPERNAEYEKGVLHGFVFGDGTVSVNNGKTYSANVQMFDVKDLDLVPLFEKHGYAVTRPDYCKAYVGRLPSEWKQLPSLDMSRSYWLGFINGLLAADGTVDKGGSVYIYQADREVLGTVYMMATEVGFCPSPLYLQREKNPWTGEDAALWRLNLKRFSVDEEDLVLVHHRTNFTENGPSVVHSMKVVAVNGPYETEEVFCCVEPETHTFVIGNGILTGNCHASGWDYAEPWAHFTFLFDALMQGGGVGSNYSNRYLSKLPRVETGLDLHLICRDDHPNIAEYHHLLTVPRSSGSYVDVGDAKHRNIYVVPDTREGWVEAVAIIMQQAFADTHTTSRESSLVIDVSGIRERGAPLKTSGGIACGPGPLVSMLSDFTKQLNSAFDRKLTTLDAMDLDHIESACVIAGGKRRSSRMSVKNWKDEDIFEFINCKREDGAHWSTNISVETDDEFERAYQNNNEHAKAVMRAVTLGSRINGEPGLWNRALSMNGEREPEEMYCPNPCGEIGLQMWENCNLGHVNLQAFAGKPTAVLKEAFRLMTRWLVRATFGDIPDARQRAVVNKNRRIGVGFFGYHGFLALRGIKYSDSYKDKDVTRTLGECRKVVDAEAARYATELGIPVPVKTTTLAPTGTIAILPGVTTSAQSIYAGWFKRRVRYSDMDPELAIKKLEGYPIYPDTDAKNTSIVEYWCEDPLVTAVRATGLDPAEIVEAQDDISLRTALEVQSSLQLIWANNGISYTINLPVDTMPSEAEMEATLMEFHGSIKGTTIFPDKSRKNSPLERLTKAEFDAYQGRKEVTTVEVVCQGGCPVK